MIPPMTFPDTAERRTAPITLGGQEFLVKELLDVQLLHLTKYARILGRDDVDRLARADAATKMLDILHSCLADKSRLPALIELEETGEVGLSDMLDFSRKFRLMDEEQAPPVAVVKRRGRPRKSA